MKMRIYDRGNNYISEVSTDIENGYQTVVRQIQNKTIAALILGNKTIQIRAIFRSHG